MHGFKLNRQNI